MRPTSIVTTTLLASLAFAAAAPAAIISPTGIRFPELAVNVKGATIVAWERRTKSAFTFEVRTGDSPSTLGRTIRFAARAYRPKVAIGADGTRAVMWFEDEGARGGVVRIAVARPGHGFGRPRVLERRRGRIGTVGVAVQPTGRVVAIWGRGSSRIAYSLAPRGGAFGAARELTFKSPSSGESIAVDPRDGAVVITYGAPPSIADLANQQAAARTLTTTATAFSEPAALSDPAGLAQASPVAVSGAGEVGVAYSRFADVAELWLVRRTATGAWTAPQRIGSPSYGAGRSVVSPIATLPTDGSALASWSVVYDPAGSGALSSQTVATIAQPGAPFGAPQALTPEDGKYGARAIASAGAEAFLATAEPHGPLLLSTRPAGGGALQTRTVTPNGDGDAVLAAGGSHVLLAFQQRDRLRLHVIR